VNITRLRWTDMAYLLILAFGYWATKLADVPAGKWPY